MAVTPKYEKNRVWNSWPSVSQLFCDFTALLWIPRNIIKLAFIKALIVGNRFAGLGLQ